LTDFGFITAKEDTALWGWENIFPLSEIDDYVDSDGSLKLKLKVAISSKQNEKREVVADDDDSEKTARLTLEESLKSGLLNGVASLLGDEESSDVTILVSKQAESPPIPKKFYCHSAILSGKIF